MQKALNPWDELGGLRREVLANSPLALVVCQVTFGAKLNATTDEVGGAFQNQIDEKYPRSHTTESFGIEVSAGLGQVAEARNVPTRRTLQFADIDLNWVVSLTNDSISLECKSYREFSEFKDRLTEVLDACIRIVRPTIMTRIGLRFINEVRVSSIESLQSYIHPDLLGSLSTPTFQQTVLRSVQSMELRVGDGAQINFNHGYFPDGTTVQIQSDQHAPKGPFYLLDLDAYHVFQGKEVRAMKSADVMKRAEKFHDTISHIFWWAVSDELVAQLRES